MANRNAPKIEKWDVLQIKYNEDWGGDKNAWLDYVTLREQYEMDMASRAISHLEKLYTVKGPRDSYELRIIRGGNQMVIMGEPQG